MKRYESIQRSLQDWALETAAGRGSVQDIRQQEAQHLLVNHREYLQLVTCSFSRRGRPSYALRTANPALAQKMEALYIAQFKARGPCSFGRRGRAAYALRTETKVQRLCNIANISADVVLRNYTLTAYEHTPFNSVGARSCALNDEDSWNLGRGVKSSRLLSAEPSPQIPIGPADASRHAMLAIAARQIYDRAYGSGFVLPLEARVKPLATQGPGAAEDTTSQLQPAGEAQELTSEPAVADTAALNVQAINMQPFEITVRDFRGRFHAVRVCGGTSVSQLKAGIAASLGCSVVSHWRLMHEGRPLVDELDLADHSISAGAVVEVQMTSRLPFHLKTRTGAMNSAIALGTGKDGVNSTSSMAVGGGAGAGAAGGGAGAGARAVVATAPNCSAAWAGPAVKGAGAVQQVVVQVLLPCGRVIQVSRIASEDVQHFLHRVLEMQKSLLQAPPGSPPSLLPHASPEALRGQLPACSIKRGLGPAGLLSGLEALSRRPSCGPANARHAVQQQLKGGAVGQKLLVLLLTAAAVVVAMAVL
ncbi:hypothetical protein VOLCADRAFT_87137 [Volvox carteri f. nagariensis]|uniref:Ubiquitin-like domain-containing protein n=1 Tax=Volvox carteri f. nagariensis TaxID=3068 RepID=D8TK98_VOLCA|nr:uncharacterized protein VOLCADRAFT_87137 [Volvox carteri f. nagariensis]EFJ52021.1 hypothetical protein VOLCADRAFT_87137 [Volvox carteri f. nagariensis]|eukprot:XP_002946795.1 hypothetical protein VOLCADRAFT_87137 [Volvox carteri f. nagariensis]